MYDEKATEHHEKKSIHQSYRQIVRILRKRWEKNRKFLFSREFRAPKIRHTKYTKHRTTANKTHNYAHTNRSVVHILILFTDFAFARIDFHLRFFHSFYQKKCFPKQLMQNIPQKKNNFVNAS